MPIFIPRIFVVHILIFDEFFFPEKGFIVLRLRGLCGWEDALRVLLGVEEEFYDCDRPEVPVKQILCLVKDQVIVQPVS